MTEAEFIAIAGRAPNELERRVNWIVDEAPAALHEPSAAFFDLPLIFPKIAVEKAERGLQDIAKRNGEIVHFIANSSLEHNALVKRIAEQQSTRDTVPGFDSEAHRAFLRGLG